MELYFLRHGKAADSNGADIPDDSSRPLTCEGIEQLQAAGQVLKQIGVAIDLILTSPLVRARQTAEVMVLQLGLREPPVATDLLGPGCDLDRLAKLLEPHKARRSVLLVGHEPDLSDMIGELIAPRGAAIVMKKAGLALVEVPRGVAAGKGVLRWLAPPKLLTRGGGSDE